jgi:hypothetical protein
MRHHLLHAIPSLGELSFPSPVPCIEIAIGIPPHTAIMTDYLHRRHVIALGTPSFHVRVVVLTYGELETPAVEVGAAVQNSFARVTILPVINALLGGCGLVL